MVLLNIAGAPGAGKSTTAAYLYYRCKKAGFRTELVGEAARELIYAGYPSQPPQPLLDNQVLLVGMQHERTLRLKRHKIEVAISDSPLIQCMLYCGTHRYAENLFKTIRDLEKEFDTYNIFLHANVGCFDPESRVQKTEVQARALGNLAKEFMDSIWAEMNWGEEAQLGDKVIKLLLDKKALDIARKTLGKTH
jgi:AAA domain